MYVRVAFASAKVYFNVREMICCGDSNLNVFMARPGPRAFFAKSRTIELFALQQDAGVSPKQSQAAGSR